jgi:hypothetical protein
MKRAERRLLACLPAFLVAITAAEVRAQVAGVQVAQAPVINPPGAATPPTVPAAQPPAPQPTGWFSTVKLSAQGEAGIVVNTGHPADSENFGQLFTDKANQVQLNQILLTAQRPTDPKVDYDIGFKFQGMYGSDARYTHFLGELNHVTADRNQFDIVEANLSIHLPWLTAGGIDVKAGQYVTPIGFETIDPSTNPFYSHSYIFNFGIPLKHTGVLATAHVNDTLDIWAGVDSGVNTTLGDGDNNGAAAGLFGFGLNNLLGGKLTVLALSHIGPENPSLTVPNADSHMRYENDIVLTYKYSDTLSFTTEGNYIRDDYFHADGYGVAQYASYTINDHITFNARGEIFRDNKGFYVAAFPGNLDFVNAERGYPASVITAPQTTYGAITLGLTFKPPLPAPVSTFMIRPEVRYDSSLNGTHPFNAGRSTGAFTIASDVVLGF